MAGRVIMAVLTLVFMVMGLLMACFALAGLQTIEYCDSAGIPVPWQAWAMLAAVVVWCMIAANIPESRIKDMGRLLSKLADE